MDKMKILILLFLIFSCSKKNVYTKQQMIQITLAADKDAQLVMPKDFIGDIKCSDYGPGCLSGHTVKIKRLDLVIIEFDSEDNAKKSAKMLNAYYKFNWLFDDVQKEPVLAKFVQDAYGATKAE